MTEPMFVGSATESPLSPPWVTTDCDRGGVHVSCQRCGGKQYVTTAGVRVQTGRAMQSERHAKPAHWLCVGR